MPHDVVDGQVVNASPDTIRLCGLLRGRLAQLVDVRLGFPDHRDDGGDIAFDAAVLRVPLRVVLLGFLIASCEAHVDLVRDLLEATTQCVHQAVQYDQLVRELIDFLADLFVACLLVLQHFSNLRQASILHCLQHLLLLVHFVQEVLVQNNRLASFC